MTVLINPGSKVPAVENTYQRAQQYAREWLSQMRSDGFGDIEMTDTGQETDGRWRFTFRHAITGVEVHLDQHGIDNPGQFTFPPRVYWGGSSSADPTMQDFEAPGFVMTFRRIC
jgi:hypothetical protein